MCFDQSEITIRRKYKFLKHYTNTNFSSKNNKPITKTKKQDLHSTEKTFDEDNWTPNKRVVVLLCRTLELCSGLFQFTHIGDLRCFLERIITKTNHFWKSNLISIANHFFQCHIKLNTKAHTSEQQIYILSNILVRACTGISLNIIDGQHRILYYIYYLLNIKNIERVNDCFNYKTKKSTDNINTRMASMSAASAAIINNNWTGKILSIHEELSTFKKISAKKQYDIEQTVKTTIKQIILSVNKSLLDTFSENCYTPLMCVSLATQRGIDLRKRLKNSGVLKTDKATELWEPKVNERHFRWYFDTFLDNLKGVPQSIFAKMANNSTEINRKKIDSKILCFPDSIPNNSTEQILPLAVCLFKIFHLAALDPGDISLLENIIKNRKQENIVYSTFFEQNFDRDSGDMKSRPLGPKYEMVSQHFSTIRNSQMIGNYKKLCEQGEFQ